MPTFSDRSINNLKTADGRLSLICCLVIKHFDFTVIDGHREEEEQNAFYEAGQSKLRWPDSAHNSYPSRAIDIAPYPIHWEDAERFVYLAGWMMAMAEEHGVKLRWGGDWDADTEVRDERFRDLGHFEIGP